MKIHMGRGRKRKVSLAPVYKPEQQPNLPQKTKARPDLVRDPNRGQVEPQRLPAYRRDGSLAITGDGEWLVPEPNLIVLWREVRRDPLGHMRANGTIDETLYDAGRHWQMLYERSQLGALAGYDYSKIRVSGGAFPEVLTDGQRRAMRELARADLALAASISEGPRGLARAILIRDVLATGMSLNKVAAMRGLGMDSESRKGLGREFRASLEVLAIEFGFLRRGGLR